jgi:DUF4097 and DUF4098 domain-containing protein YvlB
MMRTHRLLLAGLLFPAAVTAQQRVDQRFAVDTDASLRITVPAGLVRVVGWDRDTVWASGTIPRGGGSWYGGGRGGAAKMGVDRAPGTPGTGATLEIRVPARARVWVKTETAEVEATGLVGEVDVASVTGAVTLRGTPAVATVETLEGDIRVETRDGILRLRAGGGRIAVKSTGGDVTAIAVRGAVDVEAERLGRGRLESVNGPVSFTGTLAPGAALEAETHGGDVQLRFTGPVDAELDLASAAGGVTNALGDKATELRGKALRLTVGNGGAQVTARSFKGGVAILCHPEPGACRAARDRR